MEENKKLNKERIKQLSMGPKMFVLFVLGLNGIAITLVYVIAIVLGIFLGKEQCAQLGDQFYFMDTMIFVLYLFTYPILLLLGSKLSKIKFKELPFKNKEQNITKETIKFSLIMLGYLLIQLLFMIFIEWILKLLHMEMVEEPDPFSHTIIGNTYYFILLCICAPIAEEIFYRGFLLQNLLRNTNSPKLAILVTGICFGLMHMNGFPSLVIAMMGIYLAYVAYKTNSLIPSICLHFLNNFICFIEGLFPQLMSLNIAIPIDIILFIISIIVINKNKNKKIQLEPIPNGTIKLYLKSIWTYIIIALVIYGFVTSIALTI